MERKCIYKYINIYTHTHTHIHIHIGSIRFEAGKCFKHGTVKTELLKVFF